MDEAGNESPEVDATAPDTTAPDAPTDVAVTDDGTAVTGKGEPGASVVVKDDEGQVIAEGTVDENGDFEVELDPALTNGEEITVGLVDEAGNESPEVDATAPDTSGPDANPVDNDVYLIETSKSDGVKISSTGEEEAENESFGRFDINTVSLNSFDTLSIKATSDFNAIDLDEMAVEGGQLKDYAFVVEQKVNGEWIRPDLSGSDNKFDAFGVMSLSSVSAVGNSKKLKEVIIDLDLPAGEYRLALLPDRTKVSSPEKAGIKINYFNSYGSVKTVTIDEENSENSGNFITQSLGESAGDFEVTSVMFEGQQHALVDNKVTINGDYGKLTIEANGTYTYDSDKSVGKDNFTVSLSDGKSEVSSELSFNNTLDSPVAGTSIDLSNVESFEMDEESDTVEPFALTLDELISEDDNEEVPFFLDSEETDNEMLATTSSDNSIVDTTAELDVQPVVDPLDDLLNQNPSLI